MFIKHHRCSGYYDKNKCKKKIRHGHLMKSDWIPTMCVINIWTHRLYFSALLAVRCRYMTGFEPKKQNL